MNVFHKTEVLLLIQYVFFKKRGSKYIIFEANKIQTRLARKNDSLNLSFVKDVHVVGKKITRSGLKTAI